MRVPAHPTDPYPACPATPPSTGPPAPRSSPLAGPPTSLPATSLRPRLLCPCLGLNSFLERDSIPSPPVFIRLITAFPRRVKCFFLVHRRYYTRIRACFFNISRFNPIYCAELYLDRNIFGPFNS